MHSQKVKDFKKLHSRLLRLEQNKLVDSKMAEKIIDNPNDIWCKMTSFEQDEVKDKHYGY